MTSEFGPVPAVSEHYATAVDPEDDMELPEDDEIETEEQIIAQQEAIDRAIARTIVDGEEAEVVFDGGSGEPRLVVAEVTDEEALRHIAKAREQEAQYHLAAKSAVSAWKKAKERTEAAVAFAVEHWSRSRQTTLALEVPRLDNEPE